MPDKQAVSITVNFSIPKEIFPKLKTDEAGFAEYARRLVALDLYRKGVPLGFCAEAAQMSKEAFMFFLSKNKVSVFNYTDADDFLEEAKNV